MLKQLLQDDGGNLSSTRLGKLAVVFGFCTDWLAHIIRNKGFEPTWSLMALVAAVLGIAALQRKTEK